MWWWTVLCGNWQFMCTCGIVLQKLPFLHVAVMYPRDLELDLRGVE